MSLSKFRTAFSPKFQDILTKALVGWKVGNTRLQSDLSWGTTVQRNILDVSGLVVRDVVRYTDRTIGTLSDSSENIVINKQKAVDFALDSWDKLQMKPLKLGESAGKQCALKLRRYIDADLLYQTVNAHDSFDDGDIGGTAGNPITLVAGAVGTENVSTVFTNLAAKLQANNVDDNGDMVVVIDPFMAAVINQLLIGKNIALTDLTLKNGYAGPLLGFKTYISNNLTFTAILTLTEQVTEADYIIINGVTFTFNATPSGAGSVDIGSDAATTQANLILAVNGGAGAGTTYIALSDDDRATLTDSRVVATSVGTTMVITATGSGRISLSEKITHATDVWSKAMLHCYAGRAKAIDAVIQQDVQSEPRKEPKQKTINMLTDALYGLKTFADGAQKFLDLQIAIPTLTP